MAGIFRDILWHEDRKNMMDPHTCSDVISPDQGADFETRMASVALDCAHPWTNKLCLVPLT